MPSMQGVHNHLNNKTAAIVGFIIYIYIVGFIL
jgi:hypothetical protein